MRIMPIAPEGGPKWGSQGMTLGAIPAVSSPKSGQPARLDRRTGGGDGSKEHT